MITLVITLVLAVLLLGRWITRSMRSVSPRARRRCGDRPPLLGDVFTAAGEEAGGSAEYRSDLVALIGEMRPLGITTSWTVLPTGETYYGSFQSIDSESCSPACDSESCRWLVLVGLSSRASWAWSGGERRPPRWRSRRRSGVRDGRPHHPVRLPRLVPRGRRRHRV